MKFKVGDKVNIISKSLGKEFENIYYSDGKITRISGRGDGYDEDNCIEINGDWFAPHDLRYNEILEMFDELIDELNMPE